MDERIPVVGVDYPRTHQQLVAWFCPEEDCLEYLARLRWPGTRIRPASATAPGTPGSPPRGRTTPPAADACAGSPPPPPESARPHSKSTGLKQIPNTPVRDHPGRPRGLPHPVPDRAPATPTRQGAVAVSYTHLRAHETRHDLVCRLLLEKKKKKHTTK